MTFSTVLNGYRTQSGMSQHALADLAELNHSSLSRYESGERFPDRETVEALAIALGLNRSDRIRLMLSAGFVPTGIARSQDLIDAVTSMICAFEGRPLSRTARREAA